MVPVTLDDDLLARLLDPADPALRARVLTDLLDRPEHDPEVAAARARIPEQPWVKATLAAHHGDGTWGRGFYTKYDGTSWVLLHLGEVGAPMDLAPIRAGVRHLIETARPIASFGGMHARPFRDLHDGVYWTFPAACLNAHMALVLIRAGLPDHPVTRAALNVCRHRFEPGEGFGCAVMIDSLLPACVMTAPKVLKALLALPPDARTADDTGLIAGIVATLMGYGLFRYVPHDAAAWRAWAPTVAPRDRREAKAAWIAAGRLEPRRPKAGWLRFGFPLSYNSDLLEVLLLLAAAGVRRDATIDGALGLVCAARGSDGTWKMAGGLNGKMHADLDRAGRPSPWVTYRALLACKRFGVLEVAAAAA
jgi:hypothetical protein